jgi:tRNA modification GTPase
MRDTISAISTPAGEGAIALVRVSGPDALAIADRIFRGKQKPSEQASHFQQLGHVHDGARLVDQVLLAVHRAPASYTGEDVIEISCHGGMLVTTRVWEACLHAGARAARGGEFTERAFLQGKMDLTQAEAVMDLIRAQTDLALRAATEQLEGRLGVEIRALREDLLSLIAHLEAFIDFPEEDIEPDVGEKFRTRLGEIAVRMQALLATAEQGRIFREGVRTVIYGATNAGKSSLLNRLLGYDRAIVSEIPGTTRDTIEEVINLRGLPLRLIDTAGLRNGIADPIESEGMQRTERSLAQADLLLHVVDRSQPKPAEGRAAPDDRAELLLLNKSDLSAHADWIGADGLSISCTSEDGLRGLDEAILSKIGARHLDATSVLSVNARHRDCLRRALESADTAREALEKNLPPELVAVDLHAALQALGEIVGGVDHEQILSRIFSTFCIGK